MLLITTTWGSQECYTDQYDYAIFKIETTEAKLLSQKMHLFQLNKNSDKSLIEMVFRIDELSELGCEFYNESIWDREGRDTRTAEMRGAIRENKYALVERIDPDITPRDAQESRDAWLVLCEEGFFWRVCPEEDFIAYIETEVIPYDVLQKII